MSLEAAKVTTHETVWSGIITGSQLEETLIKALRDELNTPCSGLSLKIKRVVGPTAGGSLPEIHYELVHDHDWYMRKAEDAA